VGSGREGARVCGPGIRSWILEQQARQCATPARGHEQGGCQPLDNSDRWLSPRFFARELAKINAKSEKKETRELAVFWQSMEEPSSHNKPQQAERGTKQRMLPASGVSGRTQGGIEETPVSLDLNARRNKRSQSRTALTSIRELRAVCAGTSACSYTSEAALEPASGRWHRHREHSEGVHESWQEGRDT
jgi:hypothetical protein